MCAIKLKKTYNPAIFMHYLIYKYNIFGCGVALLYLKTLTWLLINVNARRREHEGNIYSL